MFERIRGRAALFAALLAAALTASFVAPATATPIDTSTQVQPPAAAAQQQVLTWTADNSMTDYASFPTTATAGPTTIVFENSEATGNTTFMSHTLTFDTTNPQYNQDVDLNIVANPNDVNGGRYEVEVNLSPGTYRYFCAIPGHSAMSGILTVTDGGGGDDTTAPVVSAEVAGDQDADGNYIGSATVSVSASDVGSGVDTVEYEIEDTGFQSYTDPVVVDEVGDHTVQYRATDNAGNTSEIGSTAFVVVEPEPDDTTAPVVSAEVTGDQDADGNYIGSATVSVSASDVGSGVDTVEYEIDDTGFQPYTDPVVVDEVGDHTVQYRATDVAGNVSETGSLPFTVVEPEPDDTTAPVASAEVAGDQDADGNFIGSATVTIDAQDAGSGVESVSYALDDGSFGPYTEPVVVDEVGDHTVQYRATDNAGNVSEIGSTAFVVVEPEPDDTTAPEVSAEVAGDQDADGNYIGSATVSVSASDAGSGVDTVEYEIDDTGFQSYTDPVVVDEVGDHTVQYRATDVAGNVSETGSLPFTVVEPEPDDTTAPEVSAEVTGDQDADGNFIGSATVTIDAQDAGSGVASVSYALDDGSFGPYTDPVVVDEVGDHTVQYRATDNAGNVSEIGSVSFTVVEPEPDDTTAPVVSAEVTGDQDADGNYIGSATVTIDAQDGESGVESVSYALDDGSFGPYTEPVTVDAVGDHTVQYRATDNAGNTSELGSVNFTVVAGEPDTCTGWDIRATVWLRDIDTGVANYDLGDGCTVNDLIDDERGWDNHGAFVRHVGDVSDDLVGDGVLTSRERSTLLRSAASSEIGKPGTTGYEMIFDGTAESLQGWTQAPGGEFELQDDGTLLARGGLGMLWYSAQEFGDFSVKLQFRDVAPEGHRANSGVFVRFPDPRTPVGERPECGQTGSAASSEAWVAIYCGQEVQIYDGESGEPQKTGSIYNFDPVGLDDAGVTPKGEWNDYEIRVVGQQYTIIRNGVVINEFENSPGQESSRPSDPPTDLRQFASGFIGLQNHSDNDAIEFRNIRVREL